MDSLARTRKSENARKSDGSRLDIRQAADSSVSIVEGRNATPAPGVDLGSAVRSGWTPTFAA
jgi:hypothetical protein